MAAAGTANAATATTPFGCRASTTRVILLTSLLVEPTVANQGTTPCKTDTAGVSTVSVPVTGTSPVVGGPAGAFTYDTTGAAGGENSTAPGAAALAAVDGVTLPSPSGGEIVVAGPIQAEASYSCVDDKLVAAASSTLNVIYINGTATPVPAGTPDTIQLGGGSYLALNEQITTANSLTERVLDLHLAGLADIVVGEAEVTTTGATPCAGTQGPPPTLTPCPNGSTYDPAALVCVIILPGGQTIVVSPPFQGPTGGTVVALGPARQRYHSACLYGAGPQFAIIGTNGPDRINGTVHADRILGLGGNDRIAGRGGADCIDGGAGNDRIWAGKGDARIYGGTGNDRVAVQDGNTYANLGAGNDLAFLGNGNDTVYGGAGNDRIAVGRGNDMVNGGAGNDRITIGNGDSKAYGGPGNDWIWVALGQSQVWGGAGNDRLWSRSEAASMNCGPGHDLAFAVPTTQAYARSHGCEQIRTVQPIKSTSRLTIH